MSSDRIESRSPQRPEDVVVAVAAADGRQVTDAAERARKAQQDWASGPASARVTALVAAADRLAAASAELAALIVREVGKPVGEATGEVARSIAILRYYAQQVLDPVGAMYEPSLRGLLYSRRRPLGLAGLITPWNFPLAIPLWKAAPALAVGNGVLLKPAPEATACALRLGELLAEVLPPGLLSVLPGDATTGTAVIDAVDVVSFTGSVEVGGAVRQAAVLRGVAVQAEMGGQNASIVLPDADCERAAADIAAAAFGYAGQKCTATSRVIVVGDATAFCDALVAAVDRLRNGNPAEPGVVVGPVIDEAARERVVAAAAGAERAGGRVIRGGVAADGSGWFVFPTLVDDVASGSHLACEEVFGPICALQHAESAAEALGISNGVRYGLVTALYTRDLDAALQLADGIDTGLVKVNAPTTGVDYYLPFGGEKESSYGPREQGKAALDFYSSVSTVTLAPSGS